MKNMRVCIYYVWMCEKDKIKRLLIRNKCYIFFLALDVVRRNFRFSPKRKSCVGKVIESLHVVKQKLRWEGRDSHPRITLRVNRSIYIRRLCPLDHLPNAKILGRFLRLNYAYATLGAPPRRRKRGWANVDFSAPSFKTRVSLWMRAMFCLSRPRLNREASLSLPFYSCS